MKVGDPGFDLAVGMPHLINSAFADDILLFARSALEVGKLLDTVVAELSEVRLLFNADKTLVLTSQGNSLRQGQGQACTSMASPF